jgi:DNA primase
MIPQTFIDEVQTRTDIGEVISSYIPLKRAGRNFKAACPFHGEKTPSFIVSPQKQIFHCFGCGEGGGVIQFLMLYEKVSFVEAIEILAARLGLTVPYQRGEREKLKTILYDVVDEAASFFSRNLNEVNQRPVINYLNKRGISEEAIKKFRLGYAAGRNTLINYLRKKKFSLNVIEKASLAIARESGYRDIFQGRVTFPICDTRSRVVGFGARIWRENKEAPKYINSLENPLYSKREHLFGLNFAKDSILKEDCVIVVEGYLDMIIPFMAGVKNIVASLGTALTLEQIRLIRRYTSNIVLVFDSDKAGQMAALRALDLLLENDLRVEVVKMPSGFDPDSVVREKGKDYFLKLVESRQDFFDYKMDVLKNMHNSNSIGGKSKIVKEMFSTINKLISEVEKYEYIKKMSEKMTIKEDVLIAEFRKMFSKDRSGLGKGSQASMREESLFSKPSKLGEEPLSIAEKVLIKFMLTNSKAFALVKNNLSEEDFVSATARQVVSYFFDNYLQENDMSSSKILGMIENKEINRFVSKILLDDSIPLDKELFRGSLIKLKQRRLTEAKNKLREEIKEAEKEGNKERLKILINEYGKINSEVRNG